jgi:hypothetical protein
MGMKSADATWFIPYENIDFGKKRKVLGAGGSGQVLVGTLKGQKGKVAIKEVCSSRSSVSIPPLPTSYSFSSPSLFSLSLSLSPPPSRGRPPP